MQVDAVVVAAGRSTRFGEGDKLLADLNGRPLVAWSLAALGEAESIGRVAIVGREDLLGALEAIGREVMGDGLAEHQVQVLQGLGPRPVGEGLAHSGHAHNAGDYGAGEAGLFGYFLAGKAVGHGVAPQFAEVGHIIVSGHQLYRADFIAQVNIFKEGSILVRHGWSYSRDA